MILDCVGSEIAKGKKIYLYTDGDRIFYNGLDISRLTKYNGLDVLLQMVHESEKIYSKYRGRPNISKAWFVTSFGVNSMLEYGDELISDTSEMVFDTNDENF